MAPYLFWELMILTIGIWVMSIVFVIYGFLLLRQQKRLFDKYLNSPKSAQQDELPFRPVGEPEDATASTPEPEQNITISKDEPISKYKDLLTSDSVNVSFVDKDE